MNSAPRPSSIEPADYTSPGRTLRWCGAVIVMSIAALRCITLHAPQTLFDTDPAFDPNPLFGLGMPGGLMLDAILLGGCAIALLGEWVAKRSIHPLLFLLALIPLPVVLWHGAADAGDLRLGSAWLAAAIACITIVHAARDQTLRTFIICILLATLIPLMLRGASQIYHEHAATIEFFEKTREQFFADRGWTQDSSAAQIYERRLRDARPLGWFATTNIFASLMAFGFIALLGMTIATARARMQSGWIGVMALLTAAAAWMLWLSGSKGAILAMLAGGTLLIVLMRFVQQDSFLVRRAGLIVIGLIAAALIGVIIRGTLLPESFAGDKSLLFRWHYMIASFGVFTDQPWLGVGTDGFQDAAMLHRVPRNPEEVSSAHSMFIDWLCTLGISGAAWIAMIMLLLARSCIAPATFTALKNASQSPRVPVTAIAIVAFAAFIPATLIDFPALDGVGLVVRFLSFAGFLAIAAAIFFVALHIPQRALHISLLAAVAALLVHSQIEMTFAQPGAVVWCMLAIGVIGAIKPTHLTPQRSILASLAHATIILIILGTAIWITINGVLPARSQQQLIQRAADALQPVRAESANITRTITARRAAADALIAAYRTWPINVLPLHAAALQLELAATIPNGPQPLALLYEARDLLNNAVAAHDRNATIVLAINLNVRLASATGDAEYWRDAIHLAQQMTQRDPHGLLSWRRLGDVLWAANERAAAADAYRRALQADANFALDELKQLTPAQRSAIEQRIAAAGQATSQ